LALSAELMKIPEPMIAPLTIMAASNAPSLRWSEVPFILPFYPKAMAKINGLSYDGMTQPPFSFFFLFIAAWVL
jgi:hypothetical protein